MIVVIARLQTDDEKRDALIAAGQKLAAASRAEDGCLNYRLHEDTEQRNHFVFVEEWESQEILEAHGKTPHIAEFMGAAGNFLTAPPDIKFHTVASTRGFGD